MALSNPLRRLVTAVWGCRQTNALWQQIFKYSIACTIAVIIAVLPPFKPASTFLTPMVIVFAHPGQRMGVMIEALLMILFGSLLGLLWSWLGLYLSSLVEGINPPASYTIRGFFLLACVLLHGYVRSSSPRLFNFVLFLLFASLLTLQLPGTTTRSLFTTIYIPILFGGGVLLTVSLSIFPELSSSYLGSSTIDALSETTDTLALATDWFVTPGGDTDEAKSQHSRPGSVLKSQNSHKSSHHGKYRPKRSIGDIVSAFSNTVRAASSHFSHSSTPPQSTRHATVAHLTEQKPKLRDRLSRCSAAQDEVNFEVSISPLPPIAMKPISTQYMTSMVQDTITLIGACENKFVVVFRDDNDGSSSADEEEQGLTVTPKPGAELPQPSSTVEPAVRNEREKKKKDLSDKLDNVKPVKEIEASSSQLLELVLARIRGPVQEFQAPLTDAVNLVISCLAYCFDVPTLPSGAPTPKGIPLEEIDLRIDQFTSSLALFDSKSAEELKRAAMDQSGQFLDFMPRMETFLVSSFILAFRDFAAQVLQILHHTRYLVEKRRRHHDRSRLWMPQYTSLRKWLSTGGETDAMVLPEKARKAARTGKDRRPATRSIQSGSFPEKDKPASKLALDEEFALGQGKHLERQKRGRPADYARKSKSASLGWVGKTRAKTADVMEWTRSSDDLGYALKLAIAVFLVTWPALVASWSAIGTSLFTFSVRLIGVIFGCVVGYLANEIGGGNRIVVVVVLLFGVVPSVYIQVATKYVKAGMISIISMAVVSFAAVGGSSTAYEIFYKRLVAFLVGGLIAMLVEIGIAPVRARDRLVESLSASVRQIQKMQAALSVGIDGPESPDLQSHTLLVSFSHARDKARGALGAAETFLPFCLREPRLKGSFKPLAPIYQEIVYVLHQIIDRIDNVVQLRRAYGSSILEDLNPKVYAYRRNVAASSTLILFSVNEALTTWLPLSQFLPSARLAHLRLINHVRGILSAEKAKSAEKPTDKAELDEEMANLITRRRFLSWNASTAGQMEIIEYLEELIELVKLLVGVNAFRSGMLERPRYRQYVGQMVAHQESLTRTGAPADGQRHGIRVASEGSSRAGPKRRRAATVSQPGGEKRSQKEEPADADGGIPRSLQRVGSRLRQDDTVVRRRAFTVGGRRV